MHGVVEGVLWICAVGIRVIPDIIFCVVLLAFLMFHPTSIIRHALLKKKKHISAQHGEL